jgi:hypothetical protein
MIRKCFNRSFAEIGTSLFIYKISGTFLEQVEHWNTLEQVFQRRFAALEKPVTRVPGPDKSSHFSPRAAVANSARKRVYY